MSPRVPQYESDEIVITGGVKLDSIGLVLDGTNPVKAFVIMASDIARCPDHNMSVEHWRRDRTCLHEEPKEDS